MVNPYRALILPVTTLVIVGLSYQVMLYACEPFLGRRQGRLQLGLRRGTHFLLRMADHDVAAELRFAGRFDGDTPAQKSRLNHHCPVASPCEATGLTHHVPVTISIIRFSTQYRSSCGRLLEKSTMAAVGGRNKTHAGMLLDRRRDEHRVGDKGSSCAVMIVVGTAIRSST